MPYLHMTNTLHQSDREGKRWSESPTPCKHVQILEGATLRRFPHIVVTGNVQNLPCHFSQQTTMKLQPTSEGSFLTAKYPTTIVGTPGSIKQIL